MRKEAETMTIRDLLKLMQEMEQRNREREEAHKGK